MIIRPRTYDMPLTDWITLALNKKTLAKTMDIVRFNQKKQKLEELLAGKRKNRHYLEKILREEVTKQFRIRERPFLEVALNAIDAKPAGVEDYHIKLKVRKKRYACIDNGVSMGLDEILTLLAIPFTTNKDPLTNIGRFGVGFFSTLKYCIIAPKNVYVLVHTNKLGESYAVRFYAPDFNEGNLRMRLKRAQTSNNRGTYVLINRRNRVDDLVYYLSENLKHIPSYVSKIRVNKKTVNESKKEKWYFKDVLLNAMDRNLRQQVGVRISDTSNIILSSQGVPVKNFENSNGNKGVIVSFPPAAEIVEGRDDFKLDQNYHRCVNASFEVLEKLIADATRDKEEFESYTRSYMLDLIPSMLSAYQMTGLSDIKNINTIRKKLLPKKEYALMHDTFSRFEPFFGREVMDRCFKVSAQSCAYWRDFYGSEDDIFRRFITIEDTVQPTKHSRWEEDERTQVDLQKYKDYPNLLLVLEKIEATDFTVHFVRMEYHGDSPFMGYGNKFYVNLEHELAKGPLNGCKVYEILNKYYNDNAVRKKIKIETDDDAEKRVRSTLTHLYDVITLANTKTIDAEDRIKVRHHAQK